MNSKKILLSLTTVIVLIALVVIPSTALATSVTTPKNLGILELRTNSEPNMAYSIGDPETNTSTLANAHIIWNIVEYTTSDYYEAKNYYCVNPSVGFNTNGLKDEYDTYYNMKTERDTVKGLSSITDTTITLDDNTTISSYDAILALGDMLYLPGESTEQEKQDLLELVKELSKKDTNASNYVEGMDTYPLTDDDINAVQQAAIWYFTNYGEDKYDNTNKTSWLYYKEDGDTGYKVLSDYNKGTHEGEIRNAQANVLYNYLIETAKSNANNYSSSSATTTAPAKVNTTTLSYEESGSNYIVGPINITESSGSNIDYDVEFAVKNGTSDSASAVSYTLLDSNKVATEKSVKDLVGENFYVLVESTNITEISISINIKYSNTTLNLWTAIGDVNGTQPVMEPKRDNISVPTNLTVTPDSKPFDLALRKYITKVNDKEVANSRVPNIDESTISSSTSTATYKHRKDPVAVDVGDIVTYKITIYNEGEKAGRATKVIDQLPTGLEFVEVVSGDYTAEYDSVKNVVNFTKKSENNLPAYTEGYLTSGKGSETIEIKCKVVATAKEADNKILTNVAWISEEVDIDGNVITDTKGLDRDSEPKTEPKANDGNLVNKDNIEDYKGNNGNKDILGDKDYYYQGQQDDDDFEKLILSYDLKLVKRITEVNGESVPERIEKVDVSKLNTWDENGELITTADYILTKDPVSVKKGDIVTYTFRIYNEGTMAGYASEITEDIPEGLEFLGSYVDGDMNEITDEKEKEAVEFNATNGWSYVEGSTNKIRTTALALYPEITDGTVDSIAHTENLIEAFGNNDGTKTEADISYKEISVKLKVVSDNLTGITIRNEACISEDTDKNGDPAEDRDSDTEEWKKENSDEYYDDDNEWPIYKEDDEDYDNIILKSFDLALRKFIVAVNDDTDINEKTDFSYEREPDVDTSKLNTKDEKGEIITTATYNHTKEPVEVKKGDIVVYMLRVYNEGETDGYAAEIKDHLPLYLEFVEGDFNDKYGWEVSEDGRTVTTKYLENAKIKKAVKEENPATPEKTYTLSYEQVPIMCRVKDTAKTGENITNIADITVYLDEDKESAIDRDSKENNVILPEDDKLPTYKDDETGEYVPGQEDDDDFEKVIIRKFDLALRKFITKIEDEDVTTRIPQVKYEDGKIVYEHDKTPMQVVTNNVVTYTIRVFNEGEIDGYAKEITDDIPEGLEFLPDNELNKTMRWKMIDSEGNETDDVSKAVKITTDYLSKEQETEEYGNLLKAFDSNKEISETNPDYKDVQVAFKVTEPNSSDKIIINSAQISDDSDKDGKDVDDEDSIPDEWNEGEDDQDREYIKLVEFDLALRKWVTQAIVIDSNGQTVTETGHGPYDDPEQVVKVELHRKKLNEVTVKFRYSIRVINEGDIAGYAKEVTDYVPQGLKFVAEDNQGWTDEGNNVISTRLLENTLLQPGEYADVEVVLTWVNSQDNMGVMTNIAEISEDYNDYGVPDRDSTPDNQKEGEDDIDDAPVMLSISTGQMRIYFTLGFIVLITIAGGVALIRKYVL